MKLKLLFVVLALAVTACAQSQPCSKENRFFLQIKPDQSVYTCDVPSTGVFTLQFVPNQDGSGSLQVTYIGPRGHLYWSQDFVWQNGVRYGACSQGHRVCWHYKPSIYYQLGGANVFLEGPFSAHD